MDFRKALQQVISKKHRKTGTRAYYSGDEVYFSRLFGYRIEGDRYVPDERYAPAIKTIFEMLAAGKTLIEVKATLDATKARDSSNNRFSYARIMALVRPIYSGYIEQRGKMLAVKNMTAITTLPIYQQAERHLRVERKKLVNQ
jgi:hypothetical protein